MCDYEECVAHPIAEGGWVQQKGTDTPARCRGLAQNSGEIEKIGSHDPCQSRVQTLPFGRSYPGALALMGGLSPIIEPAETHANSSCAQKKKVILWIWLEVRILLSEITLPLGCRQGDRCSQ
jgi:hypothetical protein